MRPSIKLNDKKVIRSWALFDWANSAFALVITVAVFPAYFTALSPDIIQIMGFEVPGSSIYAYSISIAYLLIAFASPLFSGIADYAGRRMSFLKIFTILGGLSCCGLFLFTEPSLWWVGIGFFMLGVIGFSGALVFYNSYLPIIATEDRYDNVSAKGYAFGYVGSVLLLIFNLITIQYPVFFGMEDTAWATRFSFIVVGIWWIGFGFLSFRRLPPDSHQKITFSSIKKGYLEITAVFQNIMQQKFINRFLFSFFFYSAGVQTVLFLASTFAEKELNFSSFELIGTILILQIVAIGGAYLFAWWSKKWGNKSSLIAMLLIWLSICLFGYLLEDKVQFFILSGFVGLVMGGIQSQSRSTYSKLLRKGEKDVASYFSFYDLTEKIAIVIGTFSYGFIEHMTGGMRNSLLSLGVFFAIGLIALFTVRVRRARVAPVQNIPSQGPSDPS